MDYIPNQTVNTFSFAFGKAVRQLRKNKRVTQVWLAKQMGMTSSYISLVEGGKKAPSLKFLRLACKDLQVAPEILLFCAAMPADMMKREDRELINTARRIIEEYL